MESGSSDLSIVVTWDRPMDIDISHYRIEYKRKIDAEWTQRMVNATKTSYEIMDLLPSTTYEVRIFAISTEGVSSVAVEAISITTEGMYDYVCVCVRACVCVCVCETGLIVLLHDSTQTIITVCHWTFGRTSVMLSDNNEVWSDIMEDQ